VIFSDDPLPMNRIFFVILKRYGFWAANVSRSSSMISIFFILPEPVSSHWRCRGMGNGDCAFSSKISSHSPFWTSLDPPWLITVVSSDRGSRKSRLSDLFSAHWP
jgi:hypothetical protein